MKRYTDEIDMVELTDRVGCPYLYSIDGYWIYKKDRIVSYDSMNNSYIRNCINYISKDIQNLNQGNLDHTITRVIAKMVNILPEQITESELDLVKEKLLELLERKQDEVMGVEEERNGLV